MLIHACSSAEAAVPRIRSVAAAALVNFTMPHHCTPADIKGHEQALLAALMSVVQEAPLPAVRWTR